MSKKQRYFSLLSIQKYIQQIKKMSSVQQLLVCMGVLVCSFFIGMSFLLVTTYNSLCFEMARVVEIREQYEENMFTVRCLLAETLSDKEDPGDEPQDASELDDDTDFGLTPINRERNYLGQEALDFFKEQKLMYLIHSFDDEMLKDYSLLSDSGANSFSRTTKRAKKKRPIRSLPFVSKKSHIPGKKLSWPLGKDQFWISSLYGSRKKPNGTDGFHYGVDLAARRGTPVMAVADGVVIQAVRAKGYGNTIVINHGQGVRSRYAHLDTIGVKEGARVTMGTQIGTVGATGWVRKSGNDASHLHFELYINGKRHNPLRYLHGYVA